MLMDRDKMSNLYKELSIDISYDGRQVMAKAHIAFGNQRMLCIIYLNVQ